MPDLPVFSQLPLFIEVYTVPWKGMDKRTLKCKLHTNRNAQIIFLRNYAFALGVLNTNSFYEK